MWHAIRKRLGTPLSHLPLTVHLPMQWAEPWPGAQGQAWVPSLTPISCVALSKWCRLSHAGAAFAALFARIS